MMRFGSIFFAGFLFLTCGDDGVPPLVAGIQASSEHEAETGKYRADWLLRDGAKSSWVEGKADDGIGETVTFFFNKKVKIEKIAVWNGYADAKFYPLNNRVKEIAFSADGGSETVYALKDTAARQTIDLTKTLKGKQIILKIVSVYKGSKWSDTALSGIQFLRETDGAFMPLEISPELRDRIRSQLIDDFEGLYSDERDGTTHHYLHLEKNGKCRTVALTTYNGNRSDESCSWKRSEAKLVIRESDGSAEKTFTVTDGVLKADSESDSKAALSSEYKRIMHARTTKPWEYHPMDYIAKEEKSARAALDSHR